MAGGTGGSLPKSIGNTVYGADYNAVQTKVNGVLGDGGSYGITYGYGQSLNSSAVSVSAKITSAQWASMVADVSSAYQHQNGVAYTSVNPSVGSTISASNINTLSSVCDTLLTSRQSVNAGSQTGPTTSVTSLRSAPWSSSIQSIVNISFSSIARARYFFNQASYLKLDGSYSGGTGSTQDVAWQSAMTRLTTGSGSGISGSSTFTYATYATIVAAGATYTQIYYDGYGNSPDNFASPYNQNFVKVEANTPDSGASINFRITYQDDHTPSGAGPDNVDAIVGALVKHYYSTSLFANNYTPTGLITTAF